MWIKEHPGATRATVATAGGITFLAMLVGFALAQYEGAEFVAAGVVVIVGLEVTLAWVAFSARTTP